jgi:hypothetical protein
MLRPAWRLAIIGAAITMLAADDSRWPPRPEPRIELRGSEQGGLVGVRGPFGSHLGSDQ